MNLHNLFFYIHYCSSSQLKDPKNYSYQITRTLNHHELIFLTGGHGNIIIRGKKYSIKEGMLFYIPPNTIHTFDICKEDPWHFSSVHFSVAKMHLHDEKWEVTNDSFILSKYTVRELKDYYAIQDVFQKLVITWSEKLPGYEFVSKILLGQLFIAIYQNTKKENRNYATSLKVEKVIQFMHDSIDKKITLSELSQMVHLSSFYLSKVFKETTGYSVIEYFNRMKVDKAKELLIEGDKKIKEVSEMLGFTDEFYFSRIFKKIEGISPSEYFSKNIHVD